MDVAILKASRYQLSPWYNWNIAESGVLHNANKKKTQLTNILHHRKINQVRSPSGEIQIDKH
jgi:hypothetical protein